MRCHTVLAAAAPIRVHPPRAGWKRLYRPFFYRLNHLNSRLPFLLAPVLMPLRWLIRQTVYFRALLWAALSIVPGLGHLVSGRWRALRWMLPAWVAAVAGGIFFFGTGGGSMLLGLAVALHVWIICDAGRLRDMFATVLGRVLFTILIYTLLNVYFYRDLQQRIQRNWIQSAQLGADLGMDDLRRGDFLIFWPHAYDREPPRRGDVIFYQVAGKMDDDGYQGVQIQGGETVGKILGLPGEHLQSKPGILTVTAPNGTVTSYRIDPPSTLPWEIDIHLPPDGYFCLSAGMNIVQQAHGRGNAQTRDIYTMVGQVDKKRILGRGIMIYQPLRRRSRILRHPLEVITTPPAVASVPGTGGP